MSLILFKHNLRASTTASESNKLIFLVFIIRGVMGEKSSSRDGIYRDLSALVNSFVIVEGKNMPHIEVITRPQT